jgi:thymidine kinase
MAKFYFKYGAMNSSKTANLLMIHHNYKSQGKNAIIFKPIVDTRSAKGKVESRVGISEECIDIDKDFDFIKFIKEYPVNIKIDCIEIDEAHWLTKTQCRQLSIISFKYDIPVMAFGLKNSYVDGELLEGARYLLYYATSISEIKNVCHFCGRKAIHNLRIVNGKPVYNGNQTHVGDVAAGEDYYLPACEKDYFEPDLKKLKS